MKRTKPRVLLVEDNPLEAMQAYETITQRHGEYLKDLTIVDTLREARDLLPTHTHVLTDLNFPGGRLNTNEYQRRFIPLYDLYGEQYRQRTSNEDIATRERHDAYEKLLHMLREGNELPLGIVLLEETRNQEKPGLLMARYDDRLHPVRELIREQHIPVETKRPKGWAVGLERLLKQPNQ